MYSPDGRWWWNGLVWTPAPTWRTRYESTPWTRQLQVAVLGLQGIAVLFAAATFPSIYNSLLNSNQLVSGNPALAADPRSADLVRQILVGSVVFGVALGIVVLAVVVVGVLMLWRWMYWYLMISFGLALLEVPVNLSYAFGNGPIRFPIWYLLGSIPLALVELALFAWMVIAYRRYGNWARRKVVEPG